MKKALAFLGALVLVGAPLAVFAADSFLGPIVPDSFYDKGPYLRACDLVTLFDNVAKFAVGFTVFVATLMFAYAGFLYVTASAAPKNIESAHKIFGDVALGLFWVLAAWLVVSIIMNVLGNQNIFGRLPWNQIQCVDYPESKHSPDAKGGVNAGGQTTSASCPTCSQISSLQCKNSESCSASQSMNQKLASFAATLGENAGETIVTEAGPNTTVDHIQKGKYASGDTADIGCRGSGQVAGGGCTSAWVKRNLSAWEATGGRAVYETEYASERDRLIKDGVPADKIKVYPNCSTGKRPCVTGSHFSIYN